MHETPEDLAALQDLIDRSYDSAGQHLLRIHDPKRRLNAEQVAERLTGMVLLVVATVTADANGSVDTSVVVTRKSLGATTVMITGLTLKLTARADFTVT